MSGSISLPQEQFLDAIRQDPASDIPRRAYAAFLRSIGDPRAHLIDLQCPADDIDPTERIFHAATVAERIKTLGKLERDRLNALFSLCIHRPVFERGFIVEADIPIREFTKYTDDIAREIPLLERIHLGMGIKPEEIAQLKTCTFPPHIKGISFGTYYKQFPTPIGSGDACVQELLALPNLPSLEYLCIGGSDITNHGAYQIATSPKTRLLKSLRLPRNFIDDEGVEHLCHGHLNNLKSLDLENNRLSPQSIVHLRSSPLATQLESLNVSGNKIGDEGLALLSERDIWLRLTHLDISWSSFASEAIIKFLESPLVAELTELNLAHHQLSLQIVKKLSMLSLPNLKHLILGFTGLNAGTIKALAASRNLRHCIIDVTGNSWPEDETLPPGFVQRKLGGTPAQKYYDEVLIGHENEIFFS
ncbi:hypothetical protein HYZ98_00745 [Candidatus Peregrinibacteria bacterium]|nr:hypothetical protein [Candidatus Peregrinibacteria bacterium]